MQLDQLTTQRADLNRSLKAARERSSQTAVRRKERARHITRIDEEIAEIRAALPSFESFARQERMQRVSLADLLRRATDVAPSRIAELEEAANTLEHDLGEAVGRSAQLKDVEARLTEMPDEAALTRQLDEAMTRLQGCKERESALKAAWQSVASIEQQIADLGCQFADRHAHSGRCPLCAHDWQSVPALREAIQGAAAHADRAVPSSDARLTEAEKAVTDAERDVKTAQSGIATRTRLVDSAKNLRGQLQSCWDSCQILGLPTLPLPDLTQVEVHKAQITGVLPASLHESA
jgi:chromosome segregation ATPase